MLLGCIADDFTGGERSRQLVADCSAVLLANQGSIVGAPSLASAVYAAEELEEAAELAVFSRGLAVRRLTAEAVAHLDVRYGRSLQP